MDEEEEKQDPLTYVAWVEAYSIETGPNGLEWGQTFAVEIVNDKHGIERINRFRELVI
jgi:hypothetical protein